MTASIRRRSVLGAIVTALVLACSGTASAAGNRVQLIHIDSLAPAYVVATGDGMRLAYELHLTNFAAQPVRLDSLTIRSGGGKFELDGEALRAATLHVGPDDQTAAIGPGRRAVIYIDAPGSPELRGAKIEHEFRLALMTGKGSERHVLTAGRVEVSAEPPVVLGPPLRGGPWAALYEPGLERGHRRVFYATEGRAVLPGRFAVDFMKLDTEGRTSPDGGEDPGTHYGYGAEVLAVATGVILAVCDDVADPAGRSGRGAVAISQAGGNYVALDIGGGRIVYYEHLRKGVPVKAGDHVDKGEVIGRVGMTGQAGVAHLHLHVADGVSVLGAEGLPFVFESYHRLGGYASLAAFGRGGAWADRGGPMRITLKYPAPNTVIRFAQ